MTRGVKAFEQWRWTAVIAIVLLLASSVGLNIVLSKRAAKLAGRLCQADGGLRVNGRVMGKRLLVFLKTGWDNKYIGFARGKGPQGYGAVIFYYFREHMPYSTAPQVRSYGWRAVDTVSGTTVASYREVGYNSDFISYYLRRAIVGLSPGLKTSNVCDAGPYYESLNVALFDPKLAQQNLIKMRMNPEFAENR